MGSAVGGGVMVLVGSVGDALVAGVLSVPGSQPVETSRTTTRQTKPAALVRLMLLDVVNAEPTLAECRAQVARSIRAEHYVASLCRVTAPSLALFKPAVLVSVRGGSAGRDRSLAAGRGARARATLPASAQGIGPGAFQGAAGSDLPAVSNARVPFRWRSGRGLLVDPPARGPAWLPATGRVRQGSRRGPDGESRRRPKQNATASARRRPSRGRHATNVVSVAHGGASPERHRFR